MRVFDGVDNEKEDFFWRVKSLMPGNLTHVDRVTERTRLIGWRGFCWVGNTAISR